MKHLRKKTASTFSLALRKFSFVQFFPANGFFDTEGCGGKKHFKIKDVKILDKCLTNMPSIQTGIFENVCKKNNLTAKLYTSINVKSGIVIYMKIGDKC